MIIVVTLRELIGFAILALVGIAFLIAWLLDKRKKRDK